MSSILKDEASYDCDTDGTYDSLEQLRKIQKWKWENLVDKYSTLSPGSSLAVDDIDGSSTSDRVLRKNDEVQQSDQESDDDLIVAQSIKNRSDENVENFNAWMNSPKRVSSTSLKLNLREYIHKYLLCDLDYTYVKLWSSCIRRDNKQHLWKKKYIEQLKFLKKYLQNDLILYFLRGCFHPVYCNDLVFIIEKECKSKLKEYFEIRDKKLESEEECRILIEKEWKLLKKRIPENRICFYHAMLYGPIPFN